MTEPNNITQAVKEKYGEAASRVSSGGTASCGCSPSSACCGGDPITANLYQSEQTAGIPEQAVLASLGCGNPTALAQLKAGEIVLDLGSGGGIDVLLSARRVSPGGRAYGLDASPDMVALARENAARAGAGNAEFLAGHIEDVPLPDGHVDVVISNCVISLSPDKAAALAEA